MVHSLQKVHVFQRFALARLKREHECGIRGVPDRGGQSLYECHGLVAERRLMYLHSSSADEVVQHLIEKNQVGFIPQERDDFVSTWRHATLVLRFQMLVAVLSAKRP